MPSGGPASRRPPQAAPGNARRLPCLYILWDEAQIWGLLAWRGALGLGVPYRLVRAGEIRRGLLADERPSLLLVPGGSARLKSEALGQEGLEAIREYVAEGGQYLGLCGGAGLGLTPARSKEGDGLGLCPWGRRSFKDRFQRFMSGHRQVSLPEPGHPLGPPPAGADEALLPVWWPGYILPEPVEGASPLCGPPAVLAVYTGTPGEDFWLADLPARLLPQEAFDAWQDIYGVSVSTKFMEGQPCVVRGGYGRGGYILSYSHLETPNSPFANAWLAKLLENLGGLRPARTAIPAWRLDEQAVNWADADLLACRHLARGLIDTGLEHNLLFRRNDWLYGWRSGIPGMPLTNLYAALGSLMSLPPGEAALEFWERRKAELMRKIRIFAEAARNYLLAERLAMTLAKSEPELLSGRLLEGQNRAIFGGQMRPGGLYKEIMDVIDELAWRQIEE